MRTNNTSFSPREGGWVEGDRFSFSTCFQTKTRQIKDGFQHSFYHLCIIPVWTSVCQCQACPQWAHSLALSEWKPFITLRASIIITTARLLRTNVSTATDGGTKERRTNATISDLFDKILRKSIHCVIPANLGEKRHSLYLTNWSFLYNRPVRRRHFFFFFWS